MGGNYSLNLYTVAVVYQNGGEEKTWTCTERATNIRTASADARRSFKTAMGKSVDIIKITVS